MVARVLSEIAGLLSAPRRFLWVPPMASSRLSRLVVRVIAKREPRILLVAVQKALLTMTFDDVRSRSEIG